MPQISRPIKLRLISHYTTSQDFSSSREVEGGGHLNEQVKPIPLEPPQRLIWFFHLSRAYKTPQTRFSSFPSVKLLPISDLSVPFDFNFWPSRAERRDGESSHLPQTQWPLRPSPARLNLGAEFHAVLFPIHSLALLHSLRQPNRWGFN